MNKKSIVIWVIVVIVVGVGAFFGGSAYGKGQAASAPSTFATGTGRGGFGRGGAVGTGAAGGAAAGATGTSGTIISASNNSLTIQLRTGSTQIIFLSTSTPVMKAVIGSMSDLAPGNQVTVIGTTNSDGSLTASSIQLRPSTTSPSTAQ